MSLLELVVSVAIMASIVTSAAALMRTSQTMWSTYNGDIARLDGAHAVLRHVVRELRQCWMISAISLSANSDGLLLAVTGEGDVLVWLKTGDSVNFGRVDGSALLGGDGLIGSLLGGNLSLEDLLSDILSAPNLVATNLLASDISELRFTGLKGDGISVTTTAAEVRSVQCTAVVQLDRDTNATKTLHCRAWLRAW
jgi:hypothetical protein